MQFWQVEFSSSNTGKCYIESDLLKGLRKKEPYLFEALGERIDSYTENPINNIIGNELVLVRNGLWELKFHLKKTEIRFLGRLSDDKRTFYVLCGYKKKDQRLKKLKIETALKRMN